MSIFTNAALGLLLKQRSAKAWFIVQAMFCLVLCGPIALQAQETSDPKKFWAVVAVKRLAEFGLEANSQSLNVSLISIFNNSDANLDQTVSQQDQNAFRLQSNARRRKSLFAVFRRHDVNADEVLTYEEVWSVRYAETFMRPRPGTPEYQTEKDERMEWALSLLDVENIDNLTLAEFTEMVAGKHPANLEGISPEVSPMRKEWLALDTDGNEIIEPFEFFGPVEDALKQLDGNGDGVVSADEIE